MYLCFFFFFKQKTAYEMRISDWSSDVCSSDLFEEDMPEIGIELDLDTCSAGPLAEKMRKGTVDIGFFYALGTPTEPESDLVWHEPLALFVAKDHDLAQRPHVQPSDVIKYPLVRFSERNHLGLLINEAMEQAGLGDCTVATETDDYGLILSSVRKIHGCFCMRSEEQTSELQSLMRISYAVFCLKKKK